MENVQAYGAIHPATGFRGQPPLAGTPAMTLNDAMTVNQPIRPRAAADSLSLNDMVVAVGARRDRQAFATLFAHFAPRIKAYLMRSGCEATAAEEVAQEAMVTLWRRAETFDPRQASASTWVFTIARNKRIDMVRRERRPEFDRNDPALVPEPEPPADRVAEAVQDAAIVRNALDDLPEEQQKMLRLAYFEDMPHSAIAEACGLPLGTVKSRIRLALARLRKTMKEE